MQVAIVSDIHANRHAFEAVLDDIATTRRAEIWCLGDLVGYGAEPDACVELVREHCDDLPGRQPRPRRAPASSTLDEFSRGAELAAALDARGHVAERTSTSCATLEPAGRGRRRRPLPRRPARPVWEYVLSALLAELCLDAQTPARLPRSAIPTSRSRSSRREGELATGEPRRGGDELDLADGRVAAQPGQRRPAPRRRPAGRLAAARPGCPDGAVAARRLRHRRRRRRPSAPRACLTPSNTNEKSRPT